MADINECPKCVEQDKYVKALEKILNSKNRTIDTLEKKFHIAEEGVINITQNTRRGERWDNYDLNKYCWDIVTQIKLAGVISDD